MKEHPIIFQLESIRAIQAWQKTMTRRLAGLKYINQCPDEWEVDCYVGTGVIFRRGGEGRFVKSPYGVKGDLLWCKERALPDFPKEFGYYDYSWREVPEECRKPEYCIYEASWNGSELKWRNSMFMPRWASRITLRVTGIRAEKLQELTLKDAEAEGAVVMRDIVWNEYAKQHNEAALVMSPEECFAAYWDKINGKGAWAANPWVWVIEFERADARRTG